MTDFPNLAQTQVNPTEYDEMRSYLEQQGVFGEGLELRVLRIADEHVVALRALLDAEDGLAALSGNGSGTIALTCPKSRIHELDNWLGSTLSRQP